MMKPDSDRFEEPDITETAGSDDGSAVFAAPHRQETENIGTRPSTNLVSSALSVIPSGVAPIVGAKMDEDALLTEKLEALAEFAAGAGHEINNPLAAISGRAQLLLKDETDPERRRNLLTIGAQALRIRDMIGDVMLFARPPEPRPRKVPWGRTLDVVLSKFAEQLRASQLTIEREGDQDITVWADETQLQIVISELLRNAIQFSPSGGAICFDVTRHDGDITTFTISDQGPGLSDTDREHLFDPFYSGRQAGRGLGFGLSKCWRIVTLHGGHIRPSEEDGFSIIVDWPAQSLPT